MQPRHADTLSLMGLIAFQQSDHLRAVLLIDRAIELSPGNAAAYSNVALALLELGRLADARRRLDQAIAIRPDYAEAYYNRGIVLDRMGRPNEALENYDQAITLKPDYAQAYNNRGNTLQILERLDEALESFDRAIHIKPDYAEAYYNRGVTLQELKRLDEAFDSYDRARKIDPDYRDAQWNLSLLQLLTGEFVRGWKGYEWRWDDRKPEFSRRDFKQPQWRGNEVLAGKTILLHSEQGLGDTLQFCRYAKPVADLGATVILETQKSLMGLLNGLDGVSKLIAAGEPLPEFDLHCPLLSLPLALKTDLTTIPSPEGYVSASPGKLAEWKTNLGNGDKPRVGLAWSGSPTHRHDKRRSILLGDIAEYLPDRFQYVSLQKDVREADKNVLVSRPDILHFGEALSDFADTAALCELMDIVISVDTGVAHLAGALGKEVWILLPFVPDWRWLLDRDDSPWYRSARLFRQTAASDWRGVFENVRQELEARAIADANSQ